MANFLEELGEKIGVNSKALHATVDEYNSEYSKCYEKHHDGIFAKSAEYLQPVKKGKFHAVRFHIYLMATLGGIKINEKTEVINKRHEVIPAFYATGNCGGIYADSYYLSITTGGALGFVVSSGGIAGEDVLKYIGK